MSYSSPLVDILVRHTVQQPNQPGTLRRTAQPRKQSDAKTQPKSEFKKSNNCTNQSLDQNRWKTKSVKLSTPSASHKVVHAELPTRGPRSNLQQILGKDSNQTGNHQNPGYTLNTNPIPKAYATSNGIVLNPTSHQFSNNGVISQCSQAVPNNKTVTAAPIGYNRTAGTGFNQSGAPIHIVNGQGHSIGCSSTQLAALNGIEPSPLNCLPLNSAPVILNNHTQQDLDIRSVQQPPSYNTQNNQQFLSHQGSYLPSSCPTNSQTHLSQLTNPTQTVLTNSLNTSSFPQKVSPVVVLTTSELQSVLNSGTVGSVPSVPYVSKPQVPYTGAVVPQHQSALLWNPQQNFSKMESNRWDYRVSPSGAPMVFRNKQYTSASEALEDYISNYEGKTCVKSPYSKVEDLLVSSASSTSSTVNTTDPRRTIDLYRVVDQSYKQLATTTLPVSNAHAELEVATLPESASQGQLVTSTSPVFNVADSLSESYQVLQGINTAEQQHSGINDSDLLQIQQYQQQILQQQQQQRQQQQRQQQQQQQQQQRQQQLTQKQPLKQERTPKSCLKKSASKNMRSSGSNLSKRSNQNGRLVDAEPNRRTAHAKTDRTLNDSKKLNRHDLQATKSEPITSTKRLEMLLKESEHLPVPLKLPTGLEGTSAVLLQTRALAKEALESDLFAEGGNLRHGQKTDSDVGRSSGVSGLKRQDYNNSQSFHFPSFSAKHHPETLQGILKTSKSQPNTRETVPDILHSSRNQYRQRDGLVTPDLPPPGRLDRSCSLDSLAFSSIHGGPSWLQDLNSSVSSGPKPKPTVSSTPKAASTRSRALTTDDLDLGSQLRSKSAGSRHEQYLQQLMRDIDLCDQPPPPSTVVSSGIPSKYGEEDGCGFMDRIRGLLCPEDAPPSSVGASSVGASTDRILNADRTWENMPQLPVYNPPPALGASVAEDQAAIERFLSQCIGDEKKGDFDQTLTGAHQPGGLEALKNIMFKIQHMEDTVMASTAEVDATLQSSAGDLTPNTKHLLGNHAHDEKLDKALDHLGRLKSLLDSHKT